MRCPFRCAHEETQVAETRESDEGDVIRRRRRCLHCDKRFTTYERIEIAMPAVVKKDGARVSSTPPSCAPR
jgi:transcriptional repressor NrdR